MHDVQEETTRMTLTGAVKIGSLSVTVLFAALRYFMNHKRTGKVSIQKLMKGGQRLERVELYKTELKDFCRHAKRYGISFAAIEDKTQGGYVIFFEARSQEQMQACIDSFARRKLTKEEGKEKDARQEPFRAKAQRAQEKARQQEANQEPGQKHHLGRGRGWERSR